MWHLSGCGIMVVCGPWMPGVEVRFLPARLNQFEGVLYDLYLVYV